MRAERFEYTAELEFLNSGVLLSCKTWPKSSVKED